VDSRPDTGEGHPDILLVTFDTLRTDHVSSNGYPKRTTPFIDSLAKQGIRFSRAYSSSSWTVPALASLMTSTYAERHGMDVNRRVNRQAGVIPKELPMLAELLGETGYESFGITANFGLLQLQGFDRGFDRFVSPGAVGAEEVEGLLTT
jgi:arylsulfatase